MEKAYYNGKIYTAKEITEYLQENYLIRIASRNGEFQCIDPECTHPKLIYNSGPKRGKYFSHDELGYCGYEEYNKKLTSNIKKVRELICIKICENINAEFQTDQLLTPRHYTPLVIILENSTKLAVEIEENKYPTETHKLAKLYQELNIYNQWVIIGNPYTNINELDIRPLERHQLHESINNAMIIVSPNLDIFLTAILDTDSYIYNDEEMEIPAYPKLFTKISSISELAIVNNQILYKNALKEFAEWKEAKKREFIRRTTATEAIAPPLGAEKKDTQITKRYYPPITSNRSIQTTLFEKIYICRICQQKKTSEECWTYDNNTNIGECYECEKAKRKK